MDIIMSEKFKEQLLTMIGKFGKITLDASDVDRITTPCIQLFIAADRELENNNESLKIVNASDVTIRALQDIGLGEKYTKWSS
jgi:anti-anti-sigma regulatory factor